MKPATTAPAYAAMYHELAECARKHGYALAIHGSLSRDFDLIAIPWVEDAGSPDDVIKEMTSTFALRNVDSGTAKPHGRQAYSLACGWGECALDLQFMPRVRKPYSSSDEDYDNSTN